MYYFYVIHGFKITHGDTRFFKQSTTVDLSKELLLKFNSGDDGTFDVNEQGDDKKPILRASVFLLGQVHK